METLASGASTGEYDFSCKINNVEYYGKAEDFKNKDSATEETPDLGQATEITLLKSFNVNNANAPTSANHPTPALTLSKSCTLDLNSQTLTFGKNTPIGIQVANGTSTTDNTDPENPVTTITKNTFILTDSGTGGKIVSSWDPNTANTPEAKGRTDYYKIIKGNKCYGAISVGTVYGNKGNVPSTVTSNTNSYTAFIMESGTIESKTTAVCGSQASEIVIEDGTVQSIKSCGIYFGHMGDGGGSLTVNGGTILSGSTLTESALTVDLYKDTFKDKASQVTSNDLSDDQKKELYEELYSEMPAIQISGNLKATETTININGGTIKYTKPFDVIEKEAGAPLGDPTAVYSSGKAKIAISGGEIESTGTGVEFLNGEIEVTGGTVTSTAPSYAVSSNKTTSGSTTFGAAIAIAHQKKDQSISLKISGDNTNISGPNALVAANPNKSEPGTITATIDGGNLTSNVTTTSNSSKKLGNAVLADNDNVVITVNKGKLNGNVTVAKTTNTQNNEATIVLAGGTTSGEVQVVKIDSSTKTETVLDPNSATATEDDKAATSNLKVMGTAKITNTDSANKYVAAGFKISTTGTVSEDVEANGWSLQAAGGNSYAYYVGNHADSIITAAGIDNSVALKYDSSNLLFGIPTVDSGTNFSWVGNDNQKAYHLAIYNKSNDGRAVTIKPETSSVKISGTGFIDNTIVTLTAETTADSLLGVEVDATDNNIAYMKGSYGNDKFIAGDRNTTLDGGEGNDVLEGNSGNDLFLYSKGQDQINNYTYDSDVVSLNGTGLTPPIDFSKATYDGKKIIIDFDGGNKLTFDGAAKVALLKTANNVTDTYTYDARSAGVWNYIAHEGNGISLGAGYTGTQYPGQNEEYKTIDASNVTRAIRIRGNDDGNYIVGSKLGGVLEGNDGNDSLYGSGAGTTASLTVNGGAGNDLMFGGTGYNNFVYSEGKDAISGYHDKDLINVTGRNVSFADVTVSTPDSTSDLLISFDSDNQLSIAGGATLDNPISIKSGRNNYAFTKNYFALNDKSITLTAAYDETDTAENKVFDGTERPYETINAGLVGSAISIVGNANNNYIVGGKQGNSLAGGDGDDTLVGGTAQANLFYYTKGKDVIENFRTGDKLAIDADLVGDIKSGKLTNSKLTFTVDKNNSLTFKFGDNDPFGKVSLQSSSYLTKDGIASIKSGGTDYSLDLFASAKGRIDLTDTLYSGESIKAVDAGEVKNQTVTLVGGKQGGTFTYAENKKKDGFEYGDGNVTISGYEGGRDRIDLNGVASLRSFTVKDDGGVKLTLGNEKTISIAGAKDQEVLLRDTSRGYKKMVFAKTGVVQNKKNNPTMATVSTGAGNYSAGATIKKIFVTDVSAGTSIQAGKNNTIIDASAAGQGVSLSGGAKNDKLIGSSYGDLFIYGAGKDVVQGFGTDDSISLSSEQSAKLGSAKITASKKVIKFKFSNKDVLTVKSDDTMSGALNINGTEKIYFKNAIGSGVRTSLTSEFSGTFRTQDSKRTLSEVTYVDGSKVKKNLTFSGSSEDETLIGGGKKTMFKGGGGKDSLVGSEGSKDTFFYAKGNTGDATIANFDFANDKIKVSSGIISKIEKTGDSAIKFSMTNGKSTDAAVGSFTIKSKGDGKSFDASKVAIKANNTYYWFAEDDKTYYSASTGEKIGEGTLITTENRLKNAPSDGYAVIDLNYSTNLAKNDIVAVKATTTKPTTTTT